MEIEIVSTTIVDAIDLLSFLQLTFTISCYFVLFVINSNNFSIVSIFSIFFIYILNDISMFTITIVRSKDQEVHLSELYLLEWNST